MKLSNTSTLDISALYGALLINPNGGEFYCVGVGFNLDRHAITLSMINANNPGEEIGLDWDSISDWEAELRPHRHDQGPWHDPLA